MYSAHGDEGRRSVMELTVVLVVIGVALLLGFVIGNRFAELDLRQRERRIARQRRMLHEATSELRDRREGLRAGVSAADARDADSAGPR